MRACIVSSRKIAAAGRWDPGWFLGFEHELEAEVTRLRGRLVRAATLYRDAQRALAADRNRVKYLQDSGELVLLEGSSP